jgi:hypothetical protein
VTLDRSKLRGDLGRSLIEPSLPTLAILVLGRLCLAALFIASQADGSVADDEIARFHALAHMTGTPWRDFDVEYAPLEAMIIALIAQGTLAYTGQAIVLLATLADLITAATIGLAWGKHAAGRYLLVGLPLLTFVYFRLDAIPVALTLGGFALAERRREIQAGGVLAAAVLMKIWPVVVLPALMIQRRRRAVIGVAAFVAVGIAAWLMFAGVGGPVQVATFRGATGWNVESVVGTLVWIRSGSQPIMEQGAPRIGTISAPIQVVLTFGLVLTQLAVWRRAKRFGGDSVGAPALAAVAALLAWSPLFSLQYALWLTPFIAIAAGETRGGLGALLGAVAVFGTGAVAAMRIANAYTETVEIQQVLLILRNAAVVGIIVWWFVVTRPVPNRATIPDKQ